MTSDLLRNIPFFSDLSVEERDQILAALDVRELKPGEILCREGEHGEHLYIIVKGELEVLKGIDGHEELLLNTFHDGEYLGEMSLIMEGGIRTASVRAKKASTVRSMSRLQFKDLIRRHPTLATVLSHVLSERLDSRNKADYQDLIEKNRQLKQLYDELKQLYDELKAAQAQLIEKERLEHELRLASDIQRSILPDELPEVDGFNFGACILPARHVGGDFYDVFRIGDDKMGLLIGDVADKGVPSALFMARTHALIMAEADKGMSAGEVIELVNRHITRRHKQTQFVTVLYGILNLETRELNYARAGHEPPLVLTTDGKVERLPHSRSIPLGLQENIVIDHQSVVLLPGSTLLSYTDGMLDCRNANGEAFGLERIKQTLSGLVDLNAQQVCAMLLETLKNYQEGAKQDDDVALVAIHVDSETSRIRP